MHEITGDVRITRINGSAERGGWELRFTSLSPREFPDTPGFVDPDTGAHIPARSTNVVARWQNVAVRWRSAFGECAGIERCAIVAWVMPQRFQFDHASSRSEFVAQTSDGFLRRGWIQGISFEEITSPPPRADYHQFDTNIEAMTLGRIVRHILGYYDPDVDIGPNWVAHTNMVYHVTENPHGWITLDNVMMDPFNDPADPLGSAHVTLYNIRETDNLWARLRELARNEFFVIYFDKTDTLHYKVHPMFCWLALPDPVMTFDEGFCVTPPQVIQRDIEDIQRVRLHAVTDDSGTLHSYYPPNPAPSYGKVIDISRIRCNTQAQLDTWAERTYRFANRPFTVRWTASGLCGLLFEILDRVFITYSGTDANGVHIDWVDEPFWIHEIDIIPDSYGGGVTTFLLEAENSIVYVEPM